MNNNDEFILAPPSMLANTAGPNSSRFRSRRNRKLAEFKILQPDRTLHSIRLPSHALGSDVIDQVSCTQHFLFTQCPYFYVLLFFLSFVVVVFVFVLLSLIVFIYALQ